MRTLAATLICLALLSLSPADAVVAANPDASQQSTQACNLDQLLNTLSHGEAAARADAAATLGKMGATRAVEPLIAALKDPEYKVRLAAANALGALKDPRAVDALVPIIKDFGITAAEALGKIGDPRGSAYPGRVAG